MKRITRKREEALRRPTNVSLSEALLVEAKALGVDVSRACEQGLAEALRAAKARKWQEENAAGFESWNAYVDKLNPVLRIGDAGYAFAPQSLATLTRSEPGEAVGSLSHKHDELVRALDILLSGF